MSDSAIFQDVNNELMKFEINYDGAMEDLKVCLKEAGVNGIFVVMDEAHLLDSSKEKVSYIYENKSKTPLSCAVMSMKLLGVNGCLWLGTQVGMGNCVRVASGAMTSGKNTCVFASFPYLCATKEEKNRRGEQYTVRMALEKCLMLKDINEILLKGTCFLLQGRARFTVRFIQLMLRYQKIEKNMSVKKKNKTWVKALSNIREDVATLVAEIRRTVNYESGKRVEDGYLFKLWYGGLIQGEIGKEEMFPVPITGTIAFVKGIVGTTTDYKTGIQLYAMTKVRFDRGHGEPLLLKAIENYLAEVYEEEGGLHKMQQMATSELYNMEPGPRGQWLDVVVLLRAIELSRDHGYTLGKWLGERWGKAEFTLMKIVGGRGMLNRWLEMVLKTPDAEIIPGVMARNSAVRPECNAGADGVFAAFDNGNVTIVTFACKWYSEGVPRGDWQDQADTTSHLVHQFFKPGKSHKTLAQRGEDIKTMLEKYKPKEVRVLVELPNRMSLKKWLCDDDFKNQIHGGAMVVDYRNVENVLGINVEPYAKAKK